MKSIQYDYSKLLGRIKEMYSTQEAFARKMPIGYVSLNQRLNNKLEFNSSEILIAADLLDIQKEEIPLYFFNEIA